MVFVRPLGDIRVSDAGVAGGKGANLGELSGAGFPVPDGFVVLSSAYRATMELDGILEELAALHTEALATATEPHEGKLAAQCERMRTLTREAVLTPEVSEEIVAAYRRLGTGAAVAVRASAIGEDGDESSFAGMTDSYPRVWGEHAVLERISACWASLFSPRLVAYRAKRGLTGEPVMAVVVQRTVGAQRAGVTFTADPRTGDSSIAVVEAAYGEGEPISGGTVEVDTYVVAKEDLTVLSARVAHRRVLDEASLLELVRLASRVEDHFGRPQDIEWTIDTRGVIWLVQTRPVTTPVLSTKDTPLVSGLGAAPGVASGAARVLVVPEQEAALLPGEVLVAPMSDPDWAPAIRRAAAVVTGSGGMTCHAAIVAREFGVPCVVGTGNATRVLADGMPVTVDGVAGEVRPWRPARVSGEPRHKRPPAPVFESVATRLYLDLPGSFPARQAAVRPVDGVAPLRGDALVLRALAGRHPHEVMVHGEQKSFVDDLATAMLEVTSAFAPRPVIYRASALRTDEFKALAGGGAAEPAESDPEIGYRGCYRHVRQPALFGLELDALARVRDRTPNLHLLIPFVRTRWELQECLRLVSTSALGRQRGLRRWVAAEVPSAVYWLPYYGKLGIDGVAVGVDELTELMLGAGKDAEQCAEAFDPTDPAVLDAIRAIAGEAARLGIACLAHGRALSGDPDLAARLVESGVTAVSVDPETLPAARTAIASAERRLLLRRAAAEVGRARVSSGRPL
ncbi:PEP/pyruvate-binding domain-containing protein [Amycolatopsis pigmentata]|uniref:Phosphoenolpyruvate synthase n=1 Tax=Amycolatopsis pigmentata TaxID=450801 RepID=A0ABW5G1E1_9PSEU